jgi:hypothetical protein
VGAERQMYTERALWEYLLHNRREDNLTVEVSALDQSVVTFNDKNGDAITSTRAVTVSGDNARLTETRERFDSSGRHIGTDLLVFDRIYSNFTPPTIPQNRGALAVSSIPIAGAWALNAAASVAPQTSYDLRRYEDLGQGSLGYLRVTLDKDGAPGLSIAILKADAADPAQAFRLSHPFGTLASIYAWLNNGTVPPTGMTYRVIDAYTSEMLIGNIHTRTVVARDGMRLTETQKTLNNSGEQTGESILVYDRIAP